MNKQLTLPHAYHRCRRCRRELKSVASIKRQVGAKCAKMEQRIERIFRELHEELCHEES